MTTETPSAERADGLPDVQLDETPAETGGEWAQPLTASGSYASGDEVTFEGHRYRSLIDENPWRPDVAGWERVS